MADLTRLYKNSEKKTVSVSAAMVKHTDVGDTASNELFKLPPNCVITDAVVVVEEAGQSNLTVDFGFDGGNELGNDLDIDGISVVSVPLVTSTTVTGNAETAAGTATKAPRIATGTGKTVTAKFSANPTAGKFHFIVSYIEYTKGNGDLTNLV